VLRIGLLLGHLGSEVRIPEGEVPERI
jgi:hypothetical protein